MMGNIFKEYLVSRVFNSSMYLGKKLKHKANKILISIEKQQNIENMLLRFCALLVCHWKSSRDYIKGHEDKIWGKT